MLALRVLSLLLIACGAAEERDSHPPVLRAGPDFSTREGCAREVTQDPREAVCPEGEPMEGIPLAEIYARARDLREIEDRCGSLNALLEGARQYPVPARYWLAIAQVQRELGMAFEAHASARQCVDDERTRDACRAIVDELDPGAASLLVMGPAPSGLQVRVAGEWRDVTLDQRMFELVPGPQTIMIFAPNVLCCERTLEIENGDRIEIDVEQRSTDPRECRMVQVL